MYFTVTTQGDFKNLTGFLERAKEIANRGVLNKYGEEGVKLLQSVTPVRTGKTRASWYYKVKQQGNGVVALEFHNSNIQRGQYNIAVIIQTGHATRGGSWVQGRDYINPAIRTLFDEMSANILKELK